MGSRGITKFLIKLIVKKARARAERQAIYDMLPSGELAGGSGWPGKSLSHDFRAKGLLNKVNSQGS